MAHHALVCNSRGAPPGAYSLADRDYFRRVMESGRSAVGEYVIGRGSGRPTIQFAHPLRDAAGAVTGLINLGYEPGWLGQRLAQAGLPREAAVTVSDRTGTLLVRLPDHEAWVGRPMPAAYAASLQDALAGGGGAEMPDLRGNPRIVGIVRPEGALEGMTVAVGLSRRRPSPISTRPTAAASC